MSLKKLLLSSFKEHGKRNCLWVAGETLTYAEVISRAEIVARELSAVLAPGETVGILAQRSVTAYVAILGCLLAGRAYVPLNIKNPVARQMSMAKRARCGVLIADAKSAGRRQELLAQLELADIDVMARAASAPDALAGDAASENSSDENLAYIMFTSGTTGEPKGVAVTRDNLLAYLKAIALISPIEPGSRCSHFFELSFDLSVHDMFRTWAAGGCLYVISDEETIDPVGFARKHKLDCWFSVPSVIATAQRLRRLTPNALPDLRLALFCGEALPKSAAELWSQAAPGSQIINLYGPTEATIAITYHVFNPGSPDESPTVPIGEAFPGSETIVVDDANEPVAEGATGELWLGGNQVAAGYVNNELETSQRFVHAEFAGKTSKRWYCTGDLVRIEGSCGLLYVGRRDHQVKVNGYRIELLEIEAVLRIAADTSDVAVVAWPGPSGAVDSLVGFVCGSARPESEILSSCRERLPSYMAPRKIVAVEEIPVNSNGKVDRKALVARGDGAAS